MVLNWKKIMKYCPEPVTNNLRSYTKEEIIKLLSLADPRDRCLILLMVSAGVRVGAIKTLRKKHLKKLDENNIGILTVYADSKRDCYNTPVTPECMAAIDEYLEFGKLPSRLSPIALVFLGCLNCLNLLYCESYQIY
jgi:integrase